MCWGMEQYTIPVRLICGIKINDLTVMKLRKGHTHTYSSTINNGNLNLLFVRILCESLFLVLFQTACIWNDISMVKCYRCFWFVIGNDIVFTCVQMNEMKWNERNLLLSTSKDGMSTVSFLMRLQTNTRCVWFWNTTFVCICAKFNGIIFSVVRCSTKRRLGSHIHSYPLPLWHLINRCEKFFCLRESKQSNWISTQSYEQEASATEA